MTDQSQYENDFGITSAKNSGDKTKLEAAFKQASDIRKFEIELYWKRAGYFWTLIAVAFAGYFGILSSSAISSKFFLSFVVSSIGFVFTVAWHLVNRGSKYWQENWENHLDLLEDHITGPLYKTRLERPEDQKFSEKYITGPLSISVSKINQWVSVFVSSIWLTLAAYSIHGPMSTADVTSHEWLRTTVYCGVAGLVIVAVILMLGTLSKTHQKDHTPDLRRRSTTVRRKIP